MTSRVNWLAAWAAMLLCCGSAAAGDQKLMHCFAWTAIPEATQADWDAFFKASDELPKKIKGIERVWYGKLVSPLSVAGLGQTDRETFQRYQGGETITTQVH